MNNRIIQTIIKGRKLCYVRKTEKINPYVKSDNDYDWTFEQKNELYRFTDSYRGFNPYSGVEVVYSNNYNRIIWTCDYVGYVLSESLEKPSKTYAFLKTARGKHLEECEGVFFSNFEFKNDMFLYKLLFECNGNSVLEKADIFHEEKLIAQHVASGIFYEG